MEHSKGEWVTDGEGSIYIAGYHGGGRLWITTTCCGMPKGEEEQEANAHLIAAAPDLLEACKDAELAFFAAIDVAPTRYYRNKLTKQNIKRLKAIAKAGGTNAKT